MPLTQPIPGISWDSAPQQPDYLIVGSNASMPSNVNKLTDNRVVSQACPSIAWQGGSKEERLRWASRDLISSTDQRSSFYAITKAYRPTNQPTTAEDPASPAVP